MRLRLILSNVEQVFVFTGVGQVRLLTRADELTAAEARELEPELAERAAAIVHYPQDAQVQPVQQRAERSW